MNKWKYNIDFTDHVKKYQSEEYGVEEMCMKIHEQLQAFKLYDVDYDYTNVVDELGDLVDEPEISVQEYDYWLAGLYDWADYNHTAWIVPTF